MFFLNVVFMYSNITFLFLALIDQILIVIIILGDH